MTHPVIIVGAGLAGLACALRLKDRGIPALLLEASDRVGGRVGTDRHEGFLLDRGFQVLLTAYPETARLLDYSSLHLSSFHSGAKVWKAGRLHTVGDPTRHPADALPTLISPVGTLADKARILRLVARVTVPSLSAVLAHPERSTLDYLQSDGFSSSMIDGFFRPFLGGIFLENQLVTSSRKFEFVFRMFSQGRAALPRTGMGAIPQQMAARLSPDAIRLNHRVASLEPGVVRLEDGTPLVADRIVLACDPWSTDRLLARPPHPATPTIACVYFTTGISPVVGPWLVLNGEKQGPINNLTVPSELHSEYARPGHKLISISVVDPQAAASRTLEDDVRRHATRWFGSAAQTWRHLRTYRIPNPVPLQASGTLNPVAKPAKLSDRLYTCGDDHWVASIEGAIRAGQATADTLTKPPLSGA